MSRRRNLSPSGKLANVANTMVHFGSDMTKAGASFAKTGAAGMLISLPAVETPVGAAFFTASGIVFRGGTVAAGFGIGLQVVGGLVLNAQGDSQPLLSASLQAAQALGEDKFHVPPLPFNDPLDVPIEAVAGENPCK